MALGKHHYHGEWQEPKYTENCLCIDDNTYMFTLLNYKSENRCNIHVIYILAAIEVSKFHNLQ